MERCCSCSRKFSTLEAICAALRSLGFPATLDGLDAGEALISTVDCPLRPLVREHPEAAEIDRGMWAGLVERGVRTVAATDVRCHGEGCHGNGPCHVTIELAAAG